MYRNLQGTNTKYPRRRRVCIREGVYFYGYGQIAKVGSCDFWQSIFFQDSFAYFPLERSGLPNFTARREHRGKYSYWIAYKRLDSKLYKTYIGKLVDSDPLPVLDSAAARLAKEMGWPPSDSSPDPDTPNLDAIRQQLADLQEKLASILDRR